MTNLGLMPVLIKEFRTLLRGSRSALLITLYVGLALIAMRLVYNSVAGAAGSGQPIFNAQIGQAMFIGLALTVQLLTIFLAPATTVNSISQEHERRTFELLQTTPLSAVQLLIGKLLAGLTFLLLLIVLTTPLFSIVLLFGGVGWNDIVRVLVTVFGTAVMGCVLGLFCSIFTRQTYSATLLCYALLVAVIGGTLFAANIWTLTRGGMAAPSTYVVANPLSAMASALGRTRPPEIVTSETLQPLILLSLLTQGTVLVQSGERTALPLYRATLMLYGLLSIVIFWLSLHLVRPQRRWAFGNLDLIILGILFLYGLIALLTQNWWLAGLRPPPELLNTG
jgi:ABC-type transport system involved in multi-copper enzyme maturation permease subunit